MSLQTNLAAIARAFLGTAGNQSVSFPTAFTSGPLAIVIGGQGVATPATASFGYTSGGTTISWLAIGY